MAKCEICNTNNVNRTISGMGICEACFKKINGVRNGIHEDMLYFNSEEVKSTCSERARAYLENTVRSAEAKFREAEELQKERVENEKKEMQRQEYAIARLGLYEYDVVTVLNENHGKIDAKAMTDLINKRAREGWRLHTVYSNELGKNAMHLLGLGINSTACEDVLIFERKLMD